MIDITDIIKIKVNAMRKQHDLLNHVGDLEDRIDDIKIRIYKMKIELGYEVPTNPMTIIPQTQSHAHKVESMNNAEPSLSLSERLQKNPSFRNAVRT